MTRFGRAQGPGRVPTEREGEREDESLSIETERERALLPPPSLFLQRFCPCFRPAHRISCGGVFRGEKTERVRTYLDKGRERVKQRFRLTGGFFQGRNEREAKGKCNRAGNKCSLPLFALRTSPIARSLSLSSLSQLSPARSTESPSRHAAASPPRRAAATAGIRGSAPPRPHCRRRR